MRPLGVSANLPTAAMNLSLGGMYGLVVYLFLWNTVADICVALVSFIHIIHER